MKTRTGFVSNSSSSSFIISFNKDPSIRENLVEEMGDCSVAGDGDWHDSLTADEVIDTIHAMVMNQLPATVDDLFEEFESTLSWDLYNRHEVLGRDGRYNGSNGRVDWALKQKAVDADMAIELAPVVEKFKRDNQDKFVYILEFSDSGSEYSFHQGEPFNNLTYKVVSHH